MLKLIALAALTSTAVPVAAQIAPQVEIVVTAQDLAGPAGQRRLHRRISAAAEQLCGSYATVESFQVDGITMCRDQVFGSAQQQLAALAGRGKLRLAGR